MVVVSDKQEPGTIQATFQKLVYEPEAELARKRKSKRKKNTNGAFGKSKKGKQS